MTPLVKALLAVALVVPLAAYVAGSLAASAGEAPKKQGTVFISDADPVSEETSPSTSPAPAPSRPSPTRDNQPTRAPGADDEEARVVTPTPVEDDERDDDPDDDRDDTDDGDETDD